MDQSLLKQLTPIISTITIAEAACPLADCSTICDAELNDELLRLHIEIHIPLFTQLEKIEQQLRTALDKHFKHKLDLKLTCRIKSHQSVNASKQIKGVKNVIAIASGKGGVGKSTTTVNLALALQQCGAKVGILDADIFGPSQSRLAGVPPDTRPDVKDQNTFLPIRAHGLQFMSMGFLVTEQTPMVWRGPKASGALQQMLTQTAWDDLDYLFVDMPPGTGDIQLTLSQSCPLTAAIIVTTPQDIALLDAIKGIEMFNKVNVPILGIVENMSVHVCSECGHSEAIFGEGGGERISETYNAAFLAKLPLDISIRQQADEGKPTVIAEPDGAISQLYKQAALKAMLELSKLETTSVIPNVVSIN